MKKVYKEPIFPVIRSIEGRQDDNIATPLVIKTIPILYIMRPFLLLEMQTSFKCKIGTGADNRSAERVCQRERNGGTQARIIHKKFITEYPFEAHLTKGVE